MRRSTGLAVILMVLAAAAAWSQAVQIPNPSFEQGDTGPTGWKLSGGEGAWEQTGHTGNRCVSVTGGGQDSNYWMIEGLKLEPGACYRFSYWTRIEPGTTGGCIVSGPGSVNRDFSGSEEWEQKAFVFTPVRAEDIIRLGQWWVKGKVYLDNVQLARVQPVHARRGELTLGAGESIQQGLYEFRPNWDGPGADYSRPLIRATSSFNSNRWPMGGSVEIVYRLGATGLQQQSAKVEVNLGYYNGGRCLVQAGKDGQAWQDVGAVGKEGKGEFDLPADLFPAEHVFVRLAASEAKDEAGNSKPGSFQITGFAYQAKLTDPLPDFRGETRFLAIEKSAPDVPVEVVSLGSLLPGEEQVVEMSVTNRGPRPLFLVASLGLARMGDTTGRGTGVTQTVPAGKSAVVRVPYEVPGAGEFDMAMGVSAAEGPGAKPQTQLWAARTTFDVPSLYEARYGYLLSDLGDCPLWWCEGTYKISRERPLPKEKRPAVSLSAARNEYEPVQLVLRPKQALSKVIVTVSDLAGPAGSKIPARNVTVDHVGYVHVQQATDSTGCVGDWPDPLPHYDGPFAAEAGRDHPLWLTVYEPPTAKAGDYRGAVTIQAGATPYRVPLELHVWDFTLPQESHVRSAFGFSPGEVYRYQNLKTPEERAQAVDLYFRNFAAHRINPYDPMCLGPIKVDFGAGTWTGGTRDETVKHSGARSLKIVDSDPKRVIEAGNSKLMPVQPGQKYRLSWWVKTAEPNQQYLVTLGTHDEAKQWISGHNIDIAKTGNGEWQHEEVDVTDRINDRARSVTLTLRPALWTEDGRFTGTAWFDDASLVGPDGQSMVSDPGFEQVPNAADVKVDFTAFDEQATKYLDGLKFGTSSLGLAGMGGGTFFSRTKGKIGEYEQGSPEYEALYDSYLRQLQDHLEQKGWLDKAYIYWFDEPEPRDYPFVKEGMELIKRHGPKLGRMLTEQPEPDLFGAVDIWCPVTPNYKPEVCQARQKLGEHAWWYVCTGPKAPYCALFIDHNAIELRMWLWQTWKYKVEACLVWASNYWTSSCAYPGPELQNPWQDPMSWVSGSDTPAGVKQGWGNGDGRFYYPPNQDVNHDKKTYLEGPVNSIRWEMLREGMEDAEYFYALKELVDQAPARGKPQAKVAAAAKLLEVPEAITTDLTHFTKDPQPLYAHREKLARAIEELGR